MEDVVRGRRGEPPAVFLFSGWMETARRVGMGWTRRTKKPAILDDGDDEDDAVTDEEKLRFRRAGWIGSPGRTFRFWS
jgi:hypothetical protein